MGYPHPDILLQQISGQQLAEWQAYDILEPFGSPREDYRAGVIANTNLAPHMKKGATAPSPNEIFPKNADLINKKVNADKSHQSMNEMKTALMGIVGKRK